jgi:hypothetical protein
MQNTVVDSPSSHDCIAVDCHEAGNQRIAALPWHTCYNKYEFLTSKKLTLREYTNIVSLAMCAMAGEGGGVEVAGGTRASRARAEVSAMELMDPGDMPHQIFIARTLGLGGRGGEGWCEICTTAMPVEYANLAAKVLELTSRRFFGSAYLEHMADNATARIFMTVGFEVGCRSEKHFMSGFPDQGL